jgi:hypothetical protein
MTFFFVLNEVITRNRVMNRTRKCLLAAVLSAGSMVAHAALPDPPDPREVAKFTPDQRIEAMRQLNQALAQASAQERQDFRFRTMQKWQALSKDERYEIHRRLREEWAAMSDEQQHEMRQLRKARMATLSPQERAELRRERRRMFEKMSPEERKVWREEMRHRQVTSDDESQSRSSR